MKTYFEVDGLAIHDHQLFLVAGPCVIESEELTRQIAAELKKICHELEIPFIFKASFDKANRSSIHSYRGPGLKEGLRILAGIKQDFQIPVLSDIHEPWQAQEAAKVLSVIQIPAFLSRQTDLLLAAGETGLPINLKKAQHMAAEDVFLAVKKINETGNQRIFLTERGTFFGYHNLVVDFRNIAIMKGSGYPVVIDATHSVQRPSAAGDVTGGDPQFIPLIAACGIVSGANGLFLEVHPEPDKALSDGKNALKLKTLQELLIKLKKIYNTTL